MLSTQDGSCAVCSGPPIKLNGSGKARLHVDHNHRTGKVRALLCSACNQALGLLRESPIRIKSLLSYVEKHESIQS